MCQALQTHRAARQSAARCGTASPRVQDSTRRMPGTGRTTTASSTERHETNPSGLSGEQQLTSITSDERADGCTCSPRGRAHGQASCPPRSFRTPRAPVRLETSWRGKKSTRAHESTQPPLPRGEQKDIHDANRVPTKGIMNAIVSIPSDAAVSTVQSAKACRARTRRTASCRVRGDASRAQRARGERSPAPQPGRPGGDDHGARHAAAHVTSSPPSPRSTSPSSTTWRCTPRRSPSPRRCTARRGLPASRFRSSLLARSQCASSS